GHAEPGLRGQRHPGPLGCRGERTGRPAEDGAIRVDPRRRPEGDRRRLERRRGEAHRPPRPVACPNARRSTAETSCHLYLEGEIMTRHPPGLRGVCVLVAGLLVLTSAVPPAAAGPAVKHPNLLLNREEIEQVKVKIQRHAWAARLFERVKELADDR